jgi:hypothetical protein
VTVRSSPSILLTDLLTGESRPPAGIEPIERTAADPGFSCTVWSIGRYWLKYSCGTGFGPGDDIFYLNHRTGRITGGIKIEERLFAPDAPFVDLDYARLFRPYCAPLERPDDGAHAPPYLDYESPFALHALTYRTPVLRSIRLRRCGTKRAEILTRCLSNDCRMPQLGSQYVTWGEHKRVYAYLPRIRRRILVGRPPAEFVRGRKLFVAHTCTRIFARWGDSVYVASFEPRRGAPLCQSTR